MLVPILFFRQPEIVYNNNACGMDKKSDDFFIRLPRRNFVTARNDTQDFFRLPEIILSYTK
ncbi:MAG: hypothetical protein IKI11_09955 [Neisseriaceae bacterium]|nr:hypothetical protein [Neisseriaceae bacterium]